MNEHLYAITLIESTGPKPGDETWTILGFYRDDNKAKATARSDEVVQATRNAGGKAVRIEVHKFPFTDLDSIDGFCV